MKNHKQSLVVVTGSTHGIGKSIAERFAARGATVVVNDEGTKRGKDMEDENEKMHYFSADMTSKTEIQELFTYVYEEHGEPDTLVNNVGGEAEHGSIREISDDSWHNEMNVTLRSYWLCSKYCSEIMDSGCIVNNSSIHAEVALDGWFPYNVFKSGVNMLTKHMAVELAPEIRVNAVEPGNINVEVSEVEEVGEWSETPMKRQGHADEVASVVEFLASNDASYVNGAIVPVDGGYLAGN